MGARKEVDFSAGFLFEAPGLNLRPGAQELQIDGTIAIV
jgi:hypothetical protein